jgi:dipeptidyl aminopeptidase/acylaminoacyl peptidase
MSHRQALLAALALLFGLAGLTRGDDVQALLEKRTYKDAEGKTLPYRLLRPDGYDPGTKCPLVLFLHGSG